eukprot:scaffold115015_cov65-Phaeocystis_antarctica.AAC.3
MACGREPCQACNTPSPLLSGGCQAYHCVFHVVQQRRKACAQRLNDAYSRTGREHIATALGVRRVLRGGVQSAGNTPLAAALYWRCALLHAPCTPHHASIPAICSVCVECVQPRSQPIRMHPRVLICLEDVLGLDVFQSPLQSRDHLLAQMPVIVWHWQAHCIPKHVGCTCGHLICPANEEAVIPLRLTASEHPEPAPPEPIALRRMA